MRHGLRRGATTGAVLLGLGLICVPGASAYDQTVRGCQIKPGAQCAGADLSGANLEDAPLGGANLRGANLRGANLQRANLSQANLSSADLTHANLSHANLHKADARSATLYQVHLNNANLSDADLSSVQLFGSQLPGANLIRAKLNRATAHAVNFFGADLGEASLDTADLTGSNFFGAILVRTNFTHANVSRASFVHAHFDRTRFLGATIREANVIPSDIGSDPWARHYFFARVYMHVNAYGDYGDCNIGSSYTSCSGNNDDPNATAPFSHQVSIGWGAAQNRRDTFRISAYGTVLEGRTNSNIGLFFVDAVNGTFLPDLGPTRDVMPPGHPGGPIALHVDYHGGFNPGYSINASGWLPRLNYAPPSGP
jgi:uncharacterized protein YjbI with pentapeptide repeats